MKVEILEELCYLFPVDSPWKPGWSHPKIALSCQMETEGYPLESHSESGSFPSPGDAQGWECEGFLGGPCCTFRIFERGRREGWSWHLQGSPSGKFPGRQSRFKTPLGTSVTSPPFLLRGLLWCWNCHVNSQTSLMPEDFPSQPLKTKLNITILLLQREKLRLRGSEGRLGSTSQAVNPRCPDFLSPRWIPRTISCNKA